mgnify:CR=1 FL=1
MCKVKGVAILGGSQLFVGFEKFHEILDILDAELVRYFLQGIVGQAQHFFCFFYFHFMDILEQWKSSLALYKSRQVIRVVMKMLGHVAYCQGLVNVYADPLQDFYQAAASCNIFLLEAFTGVEPPKSDWTMEDYIEIAGRMTRKEGDRTVQYGVVVNNYRADWIAWLGANNAEWFRNGKANFSDPKSIEGLRPMFEVVQKGYAPSPAVISSMGTSEDRMFITGMVAMYPSGRWVIPSFRAECDFEWDAIELPTADKV